MMQDILNQKSQPFSFKLRKEEKISNIYIENENLVNIMLNVTLSC